MKKILILLLALVFIPTKYYAYDGVVMTYFNGNIPSKVNSYIDTIHPSIFDITADGLLNIKQFDQSVILKYQQSGVKVEPYLSNHWSRNGGVTALENRESIAEEVAQAVNKYNFDGINIDIENVTDTEKDMYTDFVRILKSKLPNKNVSVAVAANPSQLQIGWHGSYDYKALGEVADYLVIMGYDEHYSNGAEGSIAGGAWVEKALNYALSLVPSNKIVLAIPFFGRGWSEDGKLKGFAVSQNDVEFIAANYKSYKGYDVNTKSAYIKFTVSPTDTPPSVLGAKNLPAGNYTLWYDDERAGRYKISLAEKYSLKGLDSWAYGQNTSKYLEIFSNSFSYFSDIQSNWAKDYINYAYENSLMIGRDEDIFDPSTGVTRAEAATAIVRYAGLENSSYEYTFKDTKGHWAEKYISIAKENALISGIGNDLYMPDSPMSRQDFSIILSNVLKLKTQNVDISFKDVSKNSYAYSAIANLVSNGIIQGYDEYNFGPERQITRAEIATLLAKSHR